MEDSNRTALASSRKLLEGERVEVRQKEKGLRGSWHSGAVVQVKFSRRVVEYDELLTLDGLKKLREIIPLYENVKFQKSVLRETNATQVQPSNRGYIRPRPPPCLLPFPQSWTRGLLVDAFYEDAWWEGILLEDLLSDNANAKVRILFPEEGDELKILVRNVRVSQEWDEATGQWAVSGLWSDETADFSSLKQICRQRRSALKDLWRQRRCNETEDWWNVERSKPFSAPISQNNMVPCTRNTALRQGGNVDLDTAVLAEVENSNAVKNGKVLLSSKVQRLESHFQGLTGPISSGPDTMCGRGQVAFSQNDSSFPVGSPDNDQCLIEKCQQKIRTSLPDQSISTVAGVSLRDVSRVLSTYGDKKGSLSVTTSQTAASSKARVDESDAKCRKTFCEQNSGKFKKQQMFSCSKKQGISNAGKAAKARPKGMGKAEVRLTRGRRALEALCEESSEHVGSSRLLKLNLQHAIAADKQPLCAESGSTECSFDGNETEKGKGIARASAGSQNLFTEHAVPINNSNDGEAFSLGKANDLLMQARLSAKRFLLDKGWRIEFQIHSVSKREVVVYVSPSGIKHFSLASACREQIKWEQIKHRNLSICARDNANVESGLLNTYYIAKGFMCLQNTPSSMSPSVLKEGKLHSLLQNGSGTSCQNRSQSMFQQEERGLNSPSVVDDSSTQEPMYDQSQLTPCAGKTGKRKQNGKDSFGLPEPRCKKSKSSLKKAEFAQDKVSHAGCRMQVLLSLPAQVQACSAPDNAEPSHFKRSTVLSWLIDKGVLKENEPVSYNSRKNGHSVKKGHVTREGVRCNCCKVVFTLSNFEAHAGSKLHRPSANIFLNDGRSISDCQMQACELQDAKEKKEGLMDSSDDTCGVCGDGGELILCDHCPSTFHPDCIGLKVIPEGDWYCPRCCCGACGGNQLAGIVNTRMHRCAQCELEYHLTCVHAPGVVKSDRASRKSWFCRRQCEEIFTALRGLVGIAHPIEKGLSWVILRSMNRDHGISPSSLEVMAEYNSKLSVAHGVMQECFVPMIDPRTKINLISQALYNRRSKVTRLNYSGFYTMLLERGDEIISVATIRIHGSKLAEMPLVGTRFQYRRQGMCRRLVHALEEMLRNVGVEKLILPAVPELLDTWKGSFRFQEMSFLERCDLIKLNLMSFPGTTLLQKHLLADAHVRESPCKIALSERVDNLDRTPCKHEKDLKTTVVALPAQGVLNLTACLQDKSHVSAEGNTCSKISLMGKSEPFVQNLHSCLGKVNHLQGESQPISQDSHCSPASGETTEGHVKFSLSKGRLKGRIKCKPLVEGVGDALVLGEESQEDDFYNTKVVLTTTRSKRLVKSCRWVVDGLKELAKDAKQSKRALSIESSVPKSPDGTQDLKCSYLMDECTQRDDGDGNGQMIENVYVRMRRREAPPLVQVDEGKEPHRALDFSGNDCVSERAVESYLSESGKHSDDETVSTTNRQLIYPLSSNYSDVGRDIGGHAIGVADKPLNNTNFFVAGSDVNHCPSDLKKYSDDSMQEAENGVLMDTKYYSRRKKKERHEDSMVVTATEDIQATPLQTGKPSALLQPSVGHEAQELETEAIVSQTYGEGQIEKAASHVFKPASSLCAIASLLPVAVEGQGVRG